MDEISSAAVEVARELRVRRSVYPRLVADGKLSQGEADRRMKAMQNALDVLVHPRLRELHRDITGVQEAQ